MILPASLSPPFLRCRRGRDYISKYKVQNGCYWCWSSHKTDATFHSLFPAFLNTFYFNCGSYFACVLHHVKGFTPSSLKRPLIYPHKDTQGDSWAQDGYSGGEININQAALRALAGLTWWNFTQFTLAAETSDRQEQKEPAVCCSNIVKL